MKISVTVLLATSSLMIANLYACSNGSSLPTTREKKQGSVTGSDVKSQSETSVQNGPNGEDNGAKSSPKSPGTDGDVGTGPKDTPGGCADAKSIADPNATFVFDAQPNSTVESSIKVFLMQTARKKNPGLGQPLEWYASGDNVTVSKLCHLKGYSTVAVYDTAKKKNPILVLGQYACGVLQWDDVSMSFTFLSKKTLDECAPHLRLLSLTCKGKLIDSCISDQSWIYGN